MAEPIININMDRNESVTLNIARFVMMMAVLFLHSYTSVQMYQDVISLPVYSRVTRFFSWQFGELGVPAFFAISGYLFFYGYRQTKECYVSKLIRRLHSLLAPYVFWNIFFLLVFYGFEYCTTVRELFNEGRDLVQNYQWQDYLRALWAEERTERPFLTQLWFVRNLLVMVLFSPIIYFLIKHLKYYLIFALGLIWYFGAQWYCEVNTLFFFFWGASFSIFDSSLVKSINSFRKPLVITFVFLSLADLIFMNHPVNLWFHRAELMLGTPFYLTLISWLVEQNIIRDVKFLSASSFFVFLVHDPMLRFIRKFSLRFMDHSSETQMILAYFGAIILDLAIVYAVYCLMLRYTPRLLSWVSGGRS